MTPSLALDFARALDPTLIAKDAGLDQLDDWQAKLIDDPPKRLLCCCGRQVGKSPKRIDGRSVWDRIKLDEAFAALIEDGSAVNEWDRI